MSKPPALSDEDRELVVSILRDRVVLDRRLIEIDALTLDIGDAIVRLRGERSTLEAERAHLLEQRRGISDKALADKFGVATNTIRDVIKHRS